MARYIDADKLIDELRVGLARTTGDAFTIAIVETTITLLREYPTADVAEVKHGECVIDRAENIVHAGRKNSTKHISYKCSECGRKFGNNKYLNYCPNCGAKMYGGKEE